jgi:hypothetical protein
MLTAMLAAGRGGLIVGVLVIGFIALAAYAIWFMFFKVGK